MVSQYKKCQTKNLQKFQNTTSRKKKEILKKRKRRKCQGYNGVSFGIHGHESESQICLEVTFFSLTLGLLGIDPGGRQSIYSRFHQQSSL